MTDNDEYIQFEILNERFTIKSDVEKEYFLSIVECLKTRIQNIKNKIPNLSNIKTIIFASLDIMDELNKLKSSALDENAVKLISDLSDSLASVIEESE